MEKYLKKKKNRNNTDVFLNKSKKEKSLDKRINEDLLGSKFRILNEKLYTISSVEAFEYFKNNPEDFLIYHKGFEIQASKWPINPNLLIIEELKKEKYENKIIADLGCGTAYIAQYFNKEKIKRILHSFDLVKINEHITECDIKNIPLNDNQVDIGIFCLSLMGVNFIDFILEAKRILKNGGILIVAEIISRIISLEDFISVFLQMGFKLSKKINIKSYFILLVFRLKEIKESKIIKKDEYRDGTSILKPCIYKKR